MKKTIFTALALCAILSSCRSAPEEPKADATAREIIQMAQTEQNNNNSKNALFYYGKLIQRYGTDTAVYVEGRFEIAHIYVKQKKYETAKPMLEEILTIYSKSQPGQLPGAFKKLAENDMKKILEAEEEKERASKK